MKVEVDKIKKSWISSSVSFIIPSSPWKYSSKLFPYWSVNCISQWIFVILPFQHFSVPLWRFELAINPLECWSRNAGRKSWERNWEPIETMKDRTLMYNYLISSGIFLQSCSDFLSSFLSLWSCSCIFLSLIRLFDASAKARELFSEVFEVRSISNHSNEHLKSDSASVQRTCMISTINILFSQHFRSRSHKTEHNLVLESITSTRQFKNLLKEAVPHRKSRW